MSDLLSWVQGIVEINSGTRNAPGVLTVQKKVADALESQGFAVEWVENPQGSQVSGPLLLARRDVKEKNPVATLVCHADTVFEPGHPFQAFRISPDGRTAYGPGIIDDKGSIAVGLEACRLFGERAPDSRLGIQFVCSPAEEVGSPGWHPLFHKLSRRSSVVFGLEPAGERGDFIVKRKGGRWYEIAVKGKEAHAGRAHHLGINAGHELAIKIDHLQRLTDYQRGNTVNLGSLEGGGGKFNIVCGSAIGRVDVRYETAKAGKALFRQIERILRTRYVGAKTSFAIMDACPPLEPRKENEPWVKFHLATLRRLEKRTYHAGFSGGGSDSSHFGRPGLAVLDGVGAGGGKIHTEGEFLHVDSLSTRSQALAELLLFARERLG